MSKIKSSLSKCFLAQCVSFIIFDSYVIVLLYRFVHVL